MNASLTREPTHVSEPKQSQDAFLPEVEGLRAVALLAVLVFHAREHWGPHGYLGVDAFFVVSGFLITRMLLTESTRHGRVDVVKFYVRRVRRLFPTLALVVIVSMVAGWFLLLPHELEELGPSASGAILSFSNFFFWSKEGYFDLASGQRPLLHTWSLGVEEQFYLVWPWLVPALAVRTGQRTMRAVLGLLGLASVVGALYYSGDLGTSGALVELERGSSAFYLPWWRAFEFVAGALLASDGIRLSERAAAVAGTVGMSVLLGAMFLDAAVPQTLRELLTCGAIMSIILGQGRGPVGWVLRTRAVRWIGRVSYSAYLWHWPLLVYARKALHRDLTTAEVLVALVTTLLLAWVSHHHVEQRFRKPAVGKPERRFLLGSGLVAIGTLGIAFGIHKYADRCWSPSDKPSPVLEAQIRQLKGHLLDYNWRVWSEAPHRFANHGGLKLLVLGDSQAADLVNVLNESKHSFDLAYHLTSAKCQVMYGIAFERYNKEIPPKYLKSCQEDHAKLQALELIPQAQAVLVAMSYRTWTVPFIEEIRSNLRAKGPRVLIVGPKTLEQPGLEFASRNFHLPPAERDRKFRFLETTMQIDRELQERLRGERYLSLVDLLCTKSSECPSLTPYGAAIYSDEMHFTHEGAKWLAPKFRRNRVVAEFLAPGMGESFE